MELQAEIMEVQKEAIVHLFPQKRLHLEVLLREPPKFSFQTKILLKYYYEDPNTLLP